MWVWILLSVLGVSASGTDEVRAVWVTRYDFRTGAEVRAVVANCDKLGFNTILFQVRGEGKPLYRSRLEFPVPGFDALEVACEEAHRRGLTLHAWVNVFPAGRSRSAPLAVRYSKWLLRERNDGYVFLDPQRPEVRAHLAAVAEEIVTRYPVDGIHLDYIRYPRNAKGSSAAVTATVRKIRGVVNEARPGTIVSAAILGTAKARASAHQDAESWVREGLVDWVFPMTYNNNDGEHARQLADNYARFSGGRCLPGVGAYRHRTGDQTVRQVRMSRGGYAVFGYASLFSRGGNARREALGVVMAGR